MSLSNLLKKRRAEEVGFKHPRFLRTSVQVQIAQKEDEKVFQILDGYHIIRNNKWMKNKSGDFIAYCTKCNRIISSKDSEICLTEIIKEIHGS